MSGRPSPPGSTPDGLRDLESHVVPAWRTWWLGCEEGWHPLLARLGADLDKMAPSWTLMQAKNKFGVLRFYADAGTDDPDVRRAFATRIAAAEAESVTTCERCGQPGTLPDSVRGRLEVLCDSCRGKARNA